MDFIQDTIGRYHAISEIKKINRGKWLPDGVDRANGTILMKGSDRVEYEVEDDEITRVVDPPLAIIPAAPGYVLLGYWANSNPDGSAFVSEDAIIAWRIHKGNRHEPIVVDFGHEWMTGINGVLAPGGGVATLFGETFSDRGAWEDSMFKKAKQEQS